MTEQTQPQIPPSIDSVSLELDGLFYICDPDAACWSMRGSVGRKCPPSLLSVHGRRIAVREEQSNAQAASTNDALVGICIPSSVEELFGPIFGENCSSRWNTR
jgi:hypothetical protein